MQPTHPVLIAPEQSALKIGCKEQGGGSRVTATYSGDEQPMMQEQLTGCFKGNIHTHAHLPTYRNTSIHTPSTLVPRRLPLTLGWPKRQEKRETVSIKVLVLMGHPEMGHLLMHVADGFCQDSNPAILVKTVVPNQCSGASRPLRAQS